MYPVQFEQYINKGDFRTTDKSEHNIDHCGCNPVSKEYAQWFLENQIWKIYDEIEQEHPELLQEGGIWELYRQRIEEKCKLDNIKYEGY